jgi:hypothetical protein
VVAQDVHPHLESEPFFDRWLRSVGGRSRVEWSRQNNRCVGRTRSGRDTASQCVVPRLAWCYHGDGLVIWPYDEGGMCESGRGETIDRQWLHRRNSSRYAGVHSSVILVL